MKKALCVMMSACLLLIATGCGNTAEEEQAKASEAISHLSEAETESEEDTGVESEVDAEPESEANVETGSDEDDIIESEESDESQEETEAQEYLYNMLLYSDEYVEITLERTASNNIYFSIANVSNQILQVACNYIQLDGVEYTYEYTEYAPPMISCAAGDTREYEFCVDGIVTIDSPVFATFTGLFEIYDEEGYLLEFAGIPETIVSEETENTESVSDYAVLYSDGYVEIAICDVQSDKIYFSITNTSDQVIQINCDYIQLDGVEYTYDGSEYSSPILYFAPESTRIYDYTGITSDGEVIFEIESTEYSEISGIFNVWDGNTGNWLESVDL